MTCTKNSVHIAMVTGYRMERTVEVKGAKSVEEYTKDSVPPEWDRRWPL